MSLEKITYGSLASSEVVNNNFEYLDNRDAVIEGKIYSNNANLETMIANVESSTNQKLSKFETDVDEKIKDIDDNLKSKIYLKTAYVNGTSGYNIWSNGYCEQWGRSNASTGNVATISLFKTYKDTNWCLITTPFGDNSTNGAWWSSFGLSRGTKNFTTRTAGQTIVWRACGYLAEGQY